MEKAFWVSINTWGLIIYVEKNSGSLASKACVNLEPHFLPWIANYLAATICQALGRRLGQCCPKDSPLGAGRRTGYRDTSWQVFCRCTDKLLPWKQRIVVHSAWKWIGLSVRKCFFEEATFDLGFEVWMEFTQEWQVKRHGDLKEHGLGQLKLIILFLLLTLG